MTEIITARAAVDEGWDIDARGRGDGAAIVLTVVRAVQGSPGPRVQAVKGANRAAAGGAVIPAGEVTPEVELGRVLRPAPRAEVDRHTVNLEIAELEDDLPLHQRGR